MRLVTHIVLASLLAVSMNNSDATVRLDAKPDVDALRRGIHVFPVRAVRVSYSHSHAGYPATDIFCPAGSQFVAPVDGTIQYVSRSDDWSPAVDNPATRGGLAVAIVGVDGWRHYGSHLSKVEGSVSLGMKVKAGQLLGLVGTSGNARGKAAHLHFGISAPSPPSDWKARRGQVNPYPYLKSWERSSRSNAESSTPDSVSGHKGHL